MVLYCCGKSLASKFKLLTVMIATTTKKKKRKRKKKRFYGYCTNWNLFFNIAEWHRSQAAQAYSTYCEAGFVHDFYYLFIFLFYFGEIVHEILDIKNMTHMHFGWDHNQDVAILAFLKH